MKQTDAKVTSLKKYKRGPYFNVGIFIFGVILIYLAVTVAMYLTGGHVQAYEVREGSIVRDTDYTGFAVRSETVETAKESGYINFFAADNSKVGAKTDVYALSSKELEFQSEQMEEGEELSADEESALVVKIQSFTENFKENDFKTVYALTNSMQSVLESKSAQSRQSQLAKMLEDSPELATVYRADTDGVISYTLDGYEQMTADQVTEQVLSKNDYSASEIKNNTKVTSGDSIYKLITEDKWQLVIQLDDAAAEELKDTTVLKVRFSKDNETEKGNFEIRQTDGVSYGVLTFYKSMIRYADDRYLDIELILDDESGLKIPQSAVTKKKFYIVPEDYLTKDETTKEEGVLIDNGKDAGEFQHADVYYKNQETGMLYLNPSAFDEGTALLHPETGESYTLSETDTLQGVYNINKGYAVFKQIQILCESDEYYIVEAGNDYGLANYDRIALDASIVKENDVIF